MIDVYEQLMGALVEDNVEELQRLIENGIDLNSRCDQGASALSGAILHGNLSIIRLMLEHGADPNLLADEPAASIYSEKPLDLARQASFLMDWEKYHSIVELLENFGATDCEGRAESDEDSKTREIRAREWQARKSVQCN
jgi:ankyrin repeat protein